MFGFDLQSRGFVGLALGIAYAGPGIGVAIGLPVAAQLIARLIDRHRWIAYVGLVIVLFVAAPALVRGAMRMKDTGGGATVMAKGWGS